jgi:hypothetical protein
MGPELDTNFSSLDINLSAKYDSYSLRIADDLADGDCFGSGTTVGPDRLVADHQDDGDDNDGVVDGARPQLAASHPRSASPSHRTAAHQASPLRVNTEITEGTQSCVDLDVTTEVEDESIDAFAKADDNDDADTRFTKRSRSSSQHDSAQSPQLAPAVAPLQQSDLTNDPLPRHRRRRNVTRIVRRKRARTPAPTGLARDASLNAAERSPPSKRLRRAKNPSGTTYHDPEKDFVCFSELSNQDVVTIPSTAMSQSEEIPICGFLTLKTFESKVIYCLSFSQELSPQSGGTYVSKSSDRRDSERSSLQKQATGTHAKHSKFSPEDDKLLR